MSDSKRGSGLQASMAALKRLDVRPERKKTDGSRIPGLKRIFFPPPSFNFFKHHFSLCCVEFQRHFQFAQNENENTFYLM